MVLHGFFGNSSGNHRTIGYLAGNLLQFRRIPDWCQYDQSWFGVGVFHVVYCDHSVSYPNPISHKISSVAKFDGFGDCVYLNISKCIGKSIRGPNRFTVGHRESERIPNPVDRCHRFTNTLYDNECISRSFSNCVSITCCFTYSVSVQICISSLFISNTNSDSIPPMVPESHRMLP